MAWYQIFYDICNNLRIENKTGGTMENEKNYITRDIIRSANEKLIKEGSHVSGYVPGKFIISCSVGMQDYHHEITRSELNTAYGKALRDAKKI